MVWQLRISLYQESTWGNMSYMTLSLLSPTVKNPGPKPPWTIRPPSWDANYTLCLPMNGESLMVVGNLTGCDESQFFIGISNHKAFFKA
jgi:hypothetical protein